jgi:Rieske Fe-S protein
VELRREGDRIIARSFVCTHQGRTVAWQEDAQRYKRPCQDAWFDAAGKPVQGPIEKPLAEFPVTVAAGTVRVTKPA